MRTIAVIPAFNEELTIASVVLMSMHHVDEVVVVNDGSSDRTAELAEKAGATVINMDENSGKGAAVLAGFSYARENGYDALVMLDADGQNDPSEIPTVLSPIVDDDADLVIGSRFLTKGHGIPAYRQVGQKVLNIVTNVSSGAMVGDSQSGFRAMNRDCLKAMIMESNGFNLETDMINKAADNEMRIAEVPVRVRYDVPNPHKKNPLSHGISVLGRVVEVMGYRRPLLTFGVLGLLCMLAGAYVVLVYTMDISVLKIALISSSWSFWSMVLVFSGFIMFIFGLMLNSQLMIKKEIIELEKKIDQRMK